MSPHVEHRILPEIRRYGRGAIIRTGALAQLLGYSQRQVYNFCVEMEKAGILTRNPRGRNWRLA